MPPRAYYPYNEWESFLAGMYAPTEEWAAAVETSQALLASPHCLFRAMSRVVSCWPKATAHNLTDLSQNRRAWLGQAACCYAHKAPEDAVREAWFRLSDRERELANLAADTVISQWDREAVGAQALFDL